jgi:hypothetical protein
MTVSLRRPICQVVLTSARSLAKDIKHPHHFCFQAELTLSLVPETTKKLVILAAHIIYKKE